MKFETYSFAGIKPAIKFMRNPLKSYHKADSDFSQPDGADFKIGDSDYDLAKRLWKGGPIHRKWMRMVYVWVDITAPLFFYSEFDTYMNVPKSSESTMHTIQREDFDGIIACLENYHDDPAVSDAYNKIVPIIQELQKQYYAAETVEEKNRIRLAMKEILPSGYMQKRGCAINYETLAHMYESRRDHRLPEWSIDFVNWVETLPYSEFITGEGFRDE